MAAALCASVASGGAGPGNWLSSNGPSAVPSRLHQDRGRWRPAAGIRHWHAARAAEGGRAAAGRHAPSQPGQPANRPDAVGWAEVNCAGGWLWRTGAGCRERDLPAQERKRRDTPSPLPSQAVTPNGIPACRNLGPRPGESPSRRELPVSLARRCGQKMSNTFLQRMWTLTAGSGLNCFAVRAYLAVLVSSQLDPLYMLPVRHSGTR